MTACSSRSAYGEESTQTWWLWYQRLKENILYMLKQLYQPYSQTETHLHVWTGRQRNPVVWSSFRGVDGCWEHQKWWWCIDGAGLVILAHTLSAASVSPLWIVLRCVGGGCLLWLPFHLLCCCQSCHRGSRARHGCWANYRGLVLKLIRNAALAWPTMWCKQRCVLE